VNAMLRISNHFYLEQASSSLTSHQLVLRSSLFEVATSLRCQSKEIVLLALDGIRKAELVLTLGATDIGTEVLKASVVFL
jgi:hypothetical protein